MLTINNRGQKYAGFSLIELMVVVVIIALLSTVVTGTMPDRDESTLISQRTHQLINWGSERASGWGEVTGVRLSADKLQIVRLLRDSTTPLGHWEPIREGRLKTSLEWSADVSVTLSSGILPETLPVRPQIIMLPDGGISDFTLVFKHQKSQWKVSSTGMAPVLLGHEEFSR